MKIMQLLLIVGAAIGLYWLVNKYAPASPPLAAGDDAPVVHVVEETLHDHAGEDSPMVHAFEAATGKSLKYKSDYACK